MAATTAKTKTCTGKTNVRTWAKRIESDFELIEALGCCGSGLMFPKLGEEYNAQWLGQDSNQVPRVAFWAVTEAGADKKSCLLSGKCLMARLRSFLPGSEIGISKHKVGWPPVPLGTIPRERDLQTCLPVLGGLESIRCCPPLRYRGLRATRGQTHAPGVRLV
jgi:hypothetical protein